MTWPLVTSIVLLAYFLGSIPFGLLVAKSRGVDIRAHGSGNIGATNVWRVMGKTFGLMTFIADACKGWLAVVAAMWLARHWAIHVALPHGHERIEYFDEGFAGIAAALGCILGHNFPVWLRFKGGKGVATSLGVIIGMMPLASLVVFGIWGIVFKLSRYVSLASLVAALCLPIVVVAMLFFGGLHSWAHFFFSVAAALMVIKRHRPNIARLIAGTELRAGEKKTTAGVEPAAESVPTPIPAAAPSATPPLAAPPPPLNTDPLNTASLPSATPPSIAPPLPPNPVAAAPVPPLDLPAP